MSAEIAVRYRRNKGYEKQMITESALQIAAVNFRNAAADFGFEFIENPSLGEGITVFGYIPQYGGKNGMVICLTAPPDFAIDQKVAEWCDRNGYFCSFLNSESLQENYDRSYFREMLRDWGKHE